MQIAHELLDFAAQSGLTGLTAPSLKAVQQGQKGYTVARGRQFLKFQQRINKDLLNHRIITNNRYTAWFKKGEQGEAQIRDFVIQFSVFSNLFLVAQLYKMINADTLDGMRASKEILANEIGVVFRPITKGQAVPAESEAGYDPDLASTEGTIQGSTFHFETAHFEWLYRLANQLGLGFKEVGKRRHGTKATLFFCSELTRLYGNENYAISQAASYAVENWAAAGFWQELIDGLTLYNKRHGVSLPLGFFLWHNQLEAQHALHTQEELEEYYFQGELDGDEFIRYGNEMLNGVAAFWDGLDKQRKSIGAGQDQS